MNTTTGERVDLLAGDGRVSLLLKPDRRFRMVVQRTGRDRLERTGSFAVDGRGVSFEEDDGRVHEGRFSAWTTTCSST